MEITSINNDLVKEIAKLQQKKYRNITGKFLLEGYKSIKEALDYGLEIEHIFVNKKNVKEYSFATDILIETTDAVLKKLSTTDSAPEAIGVGYQKKYEENILSKFKRVVLLEDIKDLGNLGTIIRSAVAFDIEAIVLYGDSVDVYNPKCVRASVGNLWKIPIIEVQSFSQLAEIFEDFNRIATLPRANNLLKTFTPKTPYLVMFGSEANGLSQELIDFSTESVKIEMAQTVESLNLATSASIIMYELGQN